MAVLAPLDSLVQIFYHFFKRITKLVTFSNSGSPVTTQASVLLAHGN